MIDSMAGKLFSKLSKKVNPSEQIIAIEKKI